ncbi:MAG: flagellar basal-body MS-ring/collar protein FliF [Pseudomonadota bacterium]
MNNILNALMGIVRNIGLRGYIAIGAGVCVLLALILVLNLRSSVDYSALYSGLNQQDTQEISNLLTTSGIEFETRSEGTAVWVDSAALDRARLLLAQEGLPRGESTIGYELFDETSNLGTSNFIQNINRLRALEGELARTISTIRGISNARVHLVLPQRELFSREEEKASGSVFLSLGAGQQLSPQQITAIRNLVASAVPKMDPAAISVTDNNGNLLAQDESDLGESMRLETVEQIRRDYEQRLRTTIQRIVGSSIGQQNVRAEVAIEMDFDRTTRREEIFDPETQVERSNQVIEEESTSQEIDEAVTVANNLPDAAAEPAAGPTTTESSRRVEQTTNYEISRVVTDSIREIGIVRRLSVAVLVNGTYAQEPDPETGEFIYLPRSEAEMQSLVALVQSTVGFNPARGDSVEVVNLEFTDLRPDPARTSVQETLQTLAGIPQSVLLPILQALVAGVIVILLIVLVVRPILLRTMDAARKSREMTRRGGLAQIFERAEKARISVQSDPALPNYETADEVSQAARQGDGSSDDRSRKLIQNLISSNKISGSVQEGLITQTSDLVSSHPEQTISVLRAWMYEQG